jgi:hypothetical protein
MSQRRHRHRRTIVLGATLPLTLALALFGCGGEDDDSPDPAGGSVDGSPSDGAATDGTAQACDPDRTLQIPNGGPITVGAYCDDIVACVDDGAAAADIEAVASDFVCEATEAIDCRFRCWFGGEGGAGEVDADVMEQVCAVSLLLDDPDVVECFIYI